MLKEIFEDAYEGLCDLFQGIIEFLDVFVERFIICLICLTMPIWILPYAIFKKRRQNNDER